MSKRGNSKDKLKVKLMSGKWAAAAALASTSDNDAEALETQSLLWGEANVRKVLAPIDNAWSLGNVPAQETVETSVDCGIFSTCSCHSLVHRIPSKLLAKPRVEMNFFTKMPHACDVGATTGLCNSYNRSVRHCCLLWGVDAGYK